GFLPHHDGSVPTESYREDNGRTKWIKDTKGTSLKGLPCCAVFKERCFLDLVWTAPGKGLYKGCDPDRAPTLRTPVYPGALTRGYLIDQGIGSKGIPYAIPEHLRITSAALACNQQ
ncbi:MAG: hypothetical protein ACXVBR_12800, partial [Flavisolibacter sp.]